jgi:hypothetical protein
MGEVDQSVFGRMYSDGVRNRSKACLYHQRICSQSEVVESLLSKRTAVPVGHNTIAVHIILTVSEPGKEMNSTMKFAGHEYLPCLRGCSFNAQLLGKRNHLGEVNCLHSKISDRSTT